MNFQVPEECADMAERNLAQARQALESFLQAARRTSESMEQTSDKVQASSKDMSQEEAFVGGGTEHPRLAGLRGAVRAGEGSARGDADPV